MLPARLFRCNLDRRNCARAEGIACTIAHEYYVWIRELLYLHIRECMRMQRRGMSTGRRANEWLRMSRHCLVRVRWHIACGIASNSISIFRSCNNAMSNKGTIPETEKPKCSATVSTTHRHTVQLLGRLETHCIRAPVVARNRFFFLLLPSTVRHSFYFVSFGWFMVSNAPLQRFSAHPSRNIVGGRGERGAEGKEALNESEIDTRWYVSARKRVAFHLLIRLINTRIVWLPLPPPLDGESNDSPAQNDIARLPPRPRRRRHLCNSVTEARTINQKQ